MKRLRLLVFEIAAIGLVLGLGGAVGLVLEDPPVPDWWQQQLTVLSHVPERRLDPERFAAKALELSKQEEVRE